jgi:putative membrane protein insertion efficiency factor
MGPIRRLLTTLLTGLVRAYQLVVRPWLPPLCRYQPSCSAYAIEALRLHGPLRGSVLAGRRICRCHPFHPGGFDPVPLPDDVTQAPPELSGR